MSYNAPIAVALVLGVPTVIFLATRKTGDADQGKKPPLKLPLIGDLHSSPVDKPLLNWDAWAKENGPIAIPKLFGLVPIVVLNSLEATTELFSRRSQWYSNRPSSVSMEMITNAEPGQSRFTLMHDYDAHLKLHHRILTPSLGPVAAPRYQPLMELESNQLVFDVLSMLRQCEDGAAVSSTNFYPFLNRTQASIILALHYGLRIPEYEEPILHEIIAIQEEVTHLAANPGLPDFIPALRHLPGFLSPWKRHADKFFARQLKTYMHLFEHGCKSPGWNATKQAVASAKKYAKDGIPDLELAFTLATSIQGGMETSPRQVLWLLVAAVTSPSFLRRAHDVLDAVVGRDRLPQFSDRPKLAYIEAIMNEMFRWRPISPGSIPRRADKADELHGVKIPKNVTVISNAFGIGRDEAVFDPSLGDLQEFVPERWLAQDEATGQVKVRDV